MTTRGQKKKARHSTNAPMDVEENDRTPKRGSTGSARRQVATPSSNVQKLYMTTKVVLKPSTEILSDLRSKYISLLQIAQEADSTVQLLPVNPKVTGSPLTSPDDIPKSNTALLKYFDTNSRLSNKGGSIWSTVYFQFEGDVEDLINRTSYDLEQQKISLSKKRLQKFQTSTPGYLLFIKNTLDTDDVTGSIVADLKMLNPSNKDYDMVVYNKEPWSGFTKSSDNNSNRKRNQWSKALHIECSRDDKKEVVDFIRQWITSGMAKERYGDHVRFIEAITPKTSEGQKERTQRMNVQGQRFQASVATTVLTGLLLPDTVVTFQDKKTKVSKTVRQLILERTTPCGDPIFLSVTRKWNSSDYEGAYVTKHASLATDFAQCPAAFLKFEQETQETTLDTDELYKAFDVISSQEAEEATWDTEKKRAVTKKEREDLADIEEASKTSWFIDTTAIELPEEDAPTRPQQITTPTGVVAFDFQDGCSVSTCRTHKDSPPERTPNVNHGSASQVTRSDTTVGSEVTMESRIDSLESHTASVSNQLQQLIQLLTPTQQLNNSGVAEPTSSALRTPAPPSGGAGL